MSAAGAAGRSQWFATQPRRVPNDVLAGTKHHGSMERDRISISWRMIYTCIYIYIHMCTYVYIYMCTYVYIYIYICIYIIYIYIYYICTYTYVYIYIYYVHPHCVHMYIQERLQHNRQHEWDDVNQSSEHQNRLRLLQPTDFGMSQDTMVFMGQRPGGKQEMWHFRPSVDDLAWRNGLKWHPCTGLAVQIKKVTNH